VGARQIDWHEALDTCLGLHIVADFLDTKLRRLAATDPTSRFGAYHARVLSDLFMIAEIDRQLRMYDEHLIGGIINSCFLDVKDAVVDTDEDLQLKALIRRDLTSEPSCLDKSKPAILRAQGAELAHEPESIRFFTNFTRPTYPESGPETQENTALKVEAEGHLDTIWDAFAKHVKKHMEAEHGKGWTLHKRLDLDTAKIPRTKPFTDSREPILRIISSNSPKPIAPPESVNDFKWEFHGIQESLPKKDILKDQSAREKIKSRGPIRPQIAQHPITEVNGEEKTDTQAQVIPLRDPHYTSIRALWTNEQVKDVPWKDFLRAMAALNFGVQKLGGNAWLFRPPVAFGFKHSVYMHEPHPKKSLYPGQASWRGRVLTRRYGWDKHTFVLAH
jgi:hypothetical protein